MKNSDLGCFYKFEPDRPVRYKREVEHVTAVEPCSFKQGYAWVYYSEQTFSDMSGLIKIYYRKNNTAYVNFNNKRYDIIPNDYRRQFINK